MKKETALSSKPPTSPAIGIFEEAKRLHQAGHLPEAERLYKQVLANDPRHADALHLLGVAADQAGRSTEGVAWIEEAIAIGDASFYRNNLGNILRRLGRIEEAILQYDQAIALKPNNADAHYNLGNLYLDQGSFDEAAKSYRRTLTLKPDHAEAHLNLGNALRELDRLAEAEKEYESATRARPDYAEAHYNLGNAWLDLGKPLEAIASYERALTLRPHHAETHLNFGNAKRSLGHFDEAIKSYRQAVAERPDYAESYTNEAITRLMAGDYAEGWPLYEWRWRTRQMEPHDFDMPLWDGHDLAGKAILLHCEQGFGDAIQFVRYASMVAARGGRVMLSCPSPLVRLFASAPGITRIFSEGSDLPACAFQAPLMSLPMIFNTTLETIPASTPYIVPAASQVTNWKTRLSDISDFKVGLVWAGNPRISRADARAVDRRRSMKLDEMAPLAMKGVRFFSLQKGTGAEQARTPPKAMELIDRMDEIEDFADTAALIANLDLVISVDTSVVHLAGAMNKPVWALSRFDGCWRWLKERSDSPWYKSVRLFRQPRMEDWASVILDVKKALEAEIKA